jgi:hypothetical protein
MAKPNYSFEKRRKELERKSKKEAKRRQKLEGGSQPTDEAPAESGHNPAPSSAEVN